MAAIVAAIFATIVAWLNLSLARLVFSPELAPVHRIAALEQFNRDTRLLVVDPTLVARQSAQHTLAGDGCTVQDGSAHLLLAGWWCLLISAPLFLFLLVRWIWRFVVWGLLLGDLAKLDLQLAVMHPDRTGGLAFISEYPPVFSAFVFALSSVFAAAAAKAILHAHVDFHIFLYLMAAWLVLIIVLFVLPLTAFMRPLGELKKRTLLESSALAERANRAVEQRWLGHAADQKDAPTPPETPSRSDLGAVYEAARKMKSLPLSKESVLPLAIAVLVPMIGVGATQLPIREILKFASRLLM